LYNIDYKGGQDMEQPQQVLDAIMPGWILLETQTHISFDSESSRSESNCTRMWIGLFAVSQYWI
jgi:hypothetical protein